MLNRITIKARLITLVLMLAGFMVLIGTGGILALRSNNASLETLYLNQLVPVGQLDKIIRLANRNQLALTNALLNGESTYENVAVEVQKLRNEEAQQWANLSQRDLPPQQAALTAQALDAYKQYDMTAVVPALDALKAKDSARLDEIMKKVAPVAFLPLRRAVDELLSLKMNRGKEKYVEGHNNFALFAQAVIFSIIVGLAVSAGVAYWLIRSITLPLNKAISIAESVAAGNLAGEIEVKTQDETGRLLAALKTMQNRLQIIVGEVREATDAIGTASAEIADGNSELSRRTESQAANLEETASSMEEITSTVKQNSDNARQANASAASATQRAIEGGNVVREMIETMGAIRESSTRIVEIISVIDSIAFQTNILALNAAVEAARAGEQGKGFAVVASEVRNLAHRSGDAAKEIAKLIGTAAQNVERGAQLMDMTGGNMEKIIDSVKTVADLINEIDAASREQSLGIEQVNQAITNIDEVTQQNAALVEEAAAAAQEMKLRAVALTKAVSVFNIGVNSTTSVGRDRKNVALLIAGSPR